MKPLDDQIPEPSAEAESKALQASMIAFRRAQKFSEQDLLEQQESTSWKYWWKSLSFAAATAAIMVTLFNVYLLFKNDSKNNDLADSAKDVLEKVANINDIKILKNAKSLFPGQIQAIEQVEGKDISLVLADQTKKISGTQPLVVEVKSGGTKKRIITFSGQTIKIPKGDGTEEEVEIYFTGQGEILMIGPTIMWRSGQNSQKGPIEIKAEGLPEEI